MVAFSIIVTLRLQILTILLDVFLCEKNSTTSWFGRVLGSVLFGGNWDYVL